jgi:tetratricopeptide (TPR) repeat protein
MSEALQRARMLLRVERPQEALRELTGVLADDPEDVDAHALMALGHAQLKRYDEATVSARQAVALAPDFAYVHYVLGTILCDRDRDKEALAAAREAIRLDPDDADHYGLEANCLAGLSRWKEMLQSAERGLALEPGNVRCMNLRAMALRQLGRADDAADVLESALAERPGDPDTHTSYGYASLQRGQYHIAVEHFREALRLEPGHSGARAGLVEALKAKNPLYRPILWWLLWCSRMSSGRGLLVMFGIMYGVRMLSRALKEVPGLAVLGGVLVIVYVFAVWTSWVGSSLFDLLLYLRRDTRDLLEEDDRRVAVAVGATMLAAPIAGVLLFALGERTGAVVAPLAFLAVAIPVSGGLSLRNRKARVLGTTIALCAVLVAVAGTSILALDALRGVQVTNVEEPGLGLVLLIAALLGAPLSTWALIGLGLIKPKR